ncbi:hypothetical protein Lal_00038227 [Lupinus albus]|nr:hypothetical protein Lal_00038227 [Lupinus albus]
MSVIDILTRVDSICNKYDKYDVEKLNDAKISGDDAFSRLYAAVDDDIAALTQKAEIASREKGKASAVAINAEIRRTKARLLEEVPKLQRLAVKKVCSIDRMIGVVDNVCIAVLGSTMRPISKRCGIPLRKSIERPVDHKDSLWTNLFTFLYVKGLSSQEFAARNDLALALPERIQAIPDGTPAAPKQTGGWSGGASDSHPEIKFDSNGRFDDEFFQQSEQSSKFRQEYEMRKMKQASLDVIAEGLGTLHEMARDMNEELDRQVPLMDEIDNKVDKASSDLKNTNVRLKHTVNQLRSSRNFCIDIILLIIILGIAAYLYNVLKN